MAARAEPPEIAISAAWHAGAIPARLSTIDGQAVEVVHRGSWSNGLGPDFADAMVLLGGRELRSGGVEIHLRTRGWTDHGHDRDARYDAVVLHVVLRHDGQPTRRRDGALVPVVDLAANGWVWSGLAADAPAWDRFGGHACAAESVKADPAPIVATLRRLGDLRLAGRSARLEAELSAAPPAEVLYRVVWDGLGYHANREPMRAVAERLPLAAVEARQALVPSAARRDVARGLLLGTAGFLPLAPADANAAGLTPDEVVGLERAWARHGAAWHADVLPPTAWTRTRVRPANHPAARLVAGAELLAAAADRGGFLAALIEPLRAGADPVATLRALAADRLGAERASAIVVSALLPFAQALAEQGGDRRLGDAASGCWDRLPTAEANERTRRAARQVGGGARLPGLGARGTQGLIHLDTTLCAPRRCFECPIAHAVVLDGSQTTAAPSHPDDIGARIARDERLFGRDQRGSQPRARVPRDNGSPKNR